MFFNFEIRGGASLSFEFFCHHFVQYQFKADNFSWGNHGRTGARLFNKFDVLDKEAENYNSLKVDFQNCVGLESG